MSAKVAEMRSGKVFSHVFVGVGVAGLDSVVVSLLSPPEGLEGLDVFYCQGRYLLLYAKKSTKKIVGG